MRRIVVFALLCLSVVSDDISRHQIVRGQHASTHFIGISKADVTGPAAQTMMMGYAYGPQMSRGIHSRLYARAYIVAEIDAAQPDVPVDERWTFISVDVGSIDSAVRERAILRAQKILIGKHELPADKVLAWYNSENVCVSATHTHSAPGSYSQHMVYHFMDARYDQLSADAISFGIANSIVDAHLNMERGTAWLSLYRVEGVSVNRSPAAFKLNPEYTENNDIDQTNKQMTVVTFVDRQGCYSGVIDWYAVHGTSMKRDNRLISGDNKGYASAITESDTLNLGDDYDAKCFKRARPFVAAFAQGNEGDSTPNIFGDVCSISGKPCAEVTSSCPVGEGLCLSRGAGMLDGDKEDIFLSTKLNGQRQADPVLEAMRNEKHMAHQLTGKLASFYKWIDIGDIKIDQDLKTCRAAFGYGFTAGTSDGLGLETNGIHQGVSAQVGHPLLTAAKIGLGIGAVSQEQKHCQYPKQVLINAGELEDWPLGLGYDLLPNTVDIQILTFGTELAILAVPGEITTIAGSRLTKAVKEVLIERYAFSANCHVVIAGLANSYSSYITTKEEYSLQRYEGASTLFGPYTNDAYIQEFKRLLVDSSQLEDHPDRKSLMVTRNLFKQADFMRKEMVIVHHLRWLDPRSHPFYDAPQLFGRSYGSRVPSKVDETIFYAAEDESSRLKFRVFAGNPRFTLEDDLTWHGTPGYTQFFKIYQFIQSDDASKQEFLVDVIDDSDFSTFYTWNKGGVGQMGTADIEWDTPEDASKFGKFRLRVFGHYKTAMSKILPYNSMIEFEVRPMSERPQLAEKRPSMLRRFKNWWSEWKLLSRIRAMFMRKHQIKGSEDSEESTRIDTALSSKTGEAKWWRPNWKLFHDRQVSDAGTTEADSDKEMSVPSTKSWWHNLGLFSRNPKIADVQPAILLEDVLSIPTEKTEVTQLPELSRVNWWNMFSRKHKIVDEQPDSTLLKDVLNTSTENTEVTQMLEQAPVNWWNGIWSWKLKTDVVQHEEVVVEPSPEEVDAELIPEPVPGSWVQNWYLFCRKQLAIAVQPDEVPKVNPTAMPSIVDTRELARAMSQS